MTNIHSAFSKSYAEARQKFLSAANSAGLQVESHIHPEKGRDGEDGTSEQGTRSKGQPQAGALQLPGNDAAIGGGSTSEGMDEQ